jgi:hypothetical protein
MPELEGQVGERAVSDDGTNKVSNDFRAAVHNRVGKASPNDSGAIATAFLPVALEGPRKRRESETPALCDRSCFAALLLFEVLKFAGKAVRRR